MIVEAEQFILRNANGQRQATLDSAESGPKLTLYDPHGKMRIMLTIGSNGPVLGFFNDEGALRVSVGALKESAVVQLHDDQGKPRVVMDLTRGEASFSHLKGDGMQRAAFRSNDEGPGLSFYDEATNTRLTLGLQEDGEPILAFLDAAGKLVFFPYNPK